MREGVGALGEVISRQHGDHYQVDPFVKRELKVSAAPHKAWKLRLLNSGERDAMHAAPRVLRRKPKLALRPP